ncbi:MAG: hypothetical protein ACTSQI_14655 [Candidatus Helarchaeota archaeon]
MVYYHIYLYTRDYAHLEIPFEIFKTIIGIIPPNQLIAANFNRYSKNQEDDLDEHISIRVDLADDIILSRIESTLKKWINQGHIFGFEIDHPAVQGFNTFEKTYFYTAHETSSACALTFYEMVRTNSQRFKEIYSSIENLTKFLIEFIPLFLEKCGFAKITNITFTKDLLINEFAESCAKTFHDTIKRTLIDDDFKFLERFLHTFFNCIVVIGEIEVEIYKFLQSKDNSLEYLASDMIFNNP